MERSDAERVSPFDSMLVSPCRGRGHAVTFASSPAQVGATRRPPSQRLQPCLSSSQTLRLDRRRRAMRDSRQPRSGAGQPGSSRAQWRLKSTRMPSPGRPQAPLQISFRAVAWFSIIRGARMAPLLIAPSFRARFRARPSSDAEALSLRKSHGRHSHWYGPGHPAIRNFARRWPSRWPSSVLGVSPPSHPRTFKGSRLNACVEAGLRVHADGAVATGTALA